MEEKFSKKINWKNEYISLKKYIAMNNIKKTLVLAPHTDDGEIGCGGFINKLVNEDVKFIIVLFL